MGALILDLRDFRHGIAAIQLPCLSIMTKNIHEVISFVFTGCWSWRLLASVADSCSFKMFTSLIDAATQHHIFPLFFFLCFIKKEHPPLFLQLSATSKVSDLPVRLQRWNGYSLFGTLVGCEETPVCLAARLGYICTGVLLRPDRWVCTTGQRWVEKYSQPLLISGAQRWSRWAALCPWHSGPSFSYLFLTRA